MRRLFMEPIGIFILAMLCQVYSCAANVSDSVERMQYASVAGEEYLQAVSYTHLTLPTMLPV